MARVTALFVAILGLALASCGKDEEKPKQPPQTPYSSTKPSKPPSGATPGGTAVPPTASQSWTGTLQPAGIGITMEGSHKLVEGGATVVLLKTTNKMVELAKFEGKRVRVTGMPSPTVEGGQTIVDVQTIVEAP